MDDQDDDDETNDESTQDDCHEILELAAEMLVMKHYRWMFLQFVYQLQMTMYNLL